MQLKILAVDKNAELSQTIQTEWLKRGIATVRVDTMQEATEKLSRESFLIVGINADNINYKPLLKIMGSTSILGRTLKTAR